MNLIVAVDKNWAIGKNNKLLASIPSDMQMFRERTTGGVVVMGRKTLESLPGGRPLPDRTNIVITNRATLKNDKIIVCNDVPTVLDKIKEYPPEKVFCIGGGSVYRLLLPYCDTAYITKIDYAYDADTYFPNLDEDREWEITEISEEQTSFDIAYHFMTYKRKNV